MATDGMCQGCHVKLRPQMFAFVLTNLWVASTIAGVTAGTIFAILSYSWELVESGATLPATLQQWSRLAEIKGRLNAGVPAA